MKLRVFILIISGLIGHPLFAEPLSNNENSKPRSSETLLKEEQPLPGFSVFLYLPLMDDSALSSIMARAQLTITPSTLLNVRAIRITTRNSFNGSCAGTVASETTIDNGAGNAVFLLAGHPYVTTDASNFAIRAANPNFTTAKDNTYELLNNTLAVIASTCVGAAAGGQACTANNCGWDIPRFWLPG